MTKVEEAEQFDWNKVFTYTREGGGDPLMIGLLRISGQIAETNKLLRELLH